MTIYQKYSHVLAELDSENRWDFESSHSSEISRIWSLLTEREPKIFNGPVLMSRDVSGDYSTLKVSLLRTSYAAFMAWRELKHPSKSAKLCFPIAAIKTSDDFFVLGIMAAHTSNPGMSYFPSGTLNDDDVLQDATVDLERSLIREIEEETGLTFEDFTLADEWIRVENDVRCAFFKEAQLKWSRLEVADRIEKFLAGQVDPELSGVVFVKEASDLAGLNLPAVQREYFEKILPDR